MKHASLCLSAFILAFLLPAVHGIDLVRNHQAESYILLSKNAGEVERHAASELSRYIKKITGAALVISDREQPGLVPICFQVSPDARISGKKQIRDDGFAVIAGRKEVRILARIPRGILYGVYHILKKHGDVCFLYPGEEGECVPQSPDFRIANGSDLQNPAFIVRKFQLNGGSSWSPDTYDWMVKNGLIIYLGNHVRKSSNWKFLAERSPEFAEGGHDMGSLLIGDWTGGTRGFLEATDKLMKEHPEYFGLVNGERLPAGNFFDRKKSQPCTSNPEVLNRMSRHCLERIAKYDNLPNFRVFCNDDHTQWCECPECKKLDCPLEKDASTNLRSTRWWHFVNYMAKEILDSGKCPNTTVTTLAYQNFRLPPLGIKPDPRVLVGIAPHQRCYIHALNDPGCNINREKFRPMFEQWASRGMRCYTFEYHPQMPGKSQYVFSEEAWVRDLQFYHSLNMAGYGMVTRAPNARYPYKDAATLYFCKNHWMSSWQRHFLTAYYSWHIDADYKTISEKINRLYYGEAWPAISKYRALLTDAVLSSNLHMGYGTPNSLLGKCYNRPGLPQKAEQYLQEGEKLASGNKLVLKRIALERDFFRNNWEEAFTQYKQTLQKEYNARKRTGRITIDGRLGEKDWQTAEFVSDFKILSRPPAVPPQADPLTFVRMLYDQDNIYFAIEAMKNRQGTVTLPARNGGVEALRGSHLEIFLTPPELQGKYYQLGFSYNGKLFQALTLTGSSRDENIRLNPEYKITDHPDRWILETRIPLQALKIRIRDGVVWRVNVARAALDSAGKLQSSSWSSGVFHGSDVHRSVAFSTGGAILRNGDLEDVRKAAPRKFKPGSKYRDWEYLSPDVPNFWAFNINNHGRMELRHDQPASGKNYMRLWGRYAFIFQYGLNFPKDKPIRCKLSLQARGKGELSLRLYQAGKGKYFSGEKPVINFNSPDKWQTLENIVTAPDPEKMAFAMRINGQDIDVDDIRITPLPSEEEMMPTADKHR